MSRNNELPIDPMHEPESNETRNRLAEVEEHLKKARPRPVQFDVAALQRQAGSTPLRQQVAAPRRRRYRVAALVAGSWACGACLGALAMFLLMQQTVPQTDSSTTLAHDEQEPASHDSGPTLERPATPAPRRRDDGRSIRMDAAVLALAIPYLDAPDWQTDSGLRAGMCRPRFMETTRENLLSVNTPSDAISQPDPVFVAPAQPHAYPAPSPGITREQLMHDLLGESSGFVL